MKIKRFYEPVFNASLIFVYDAKPETAQKYLERKFKGAQLDFGDCDGQTGVFNYSTGETVFYIYLEEGVSISVLVHEISHLTFSIFDNRGIGKSDTELVAYYNGYWYERLSKVYEATHSD